MHVERYEGTASEWDRFAEVQPGFTHCHRYGWRSVMERVFGHECIYLLARESDQIRAVLPLVRVRSAVFGHYLVSMPFLNYGGPLGSDEGVRAVTDAAVDRAERDGAKLLELRSRHELPLQLPVSHRRITVVLDLAATAEQSLRAFTGKLRSQIRRPQKEGVTVEFGTAQVEPFFGVFARHMRDLGTPTLPLRLFNAIASTFPEDVWLACAYLDGRAVAAGCGLKCGTEFEMVWASSLREYNRYSPNMLLYWACMERAIDEGLTVFNFGRCAPGSNTHRFKQQWGGRDVPLWWYGRARGGVTATPSPRDGAFQWGPRIWRMLPVKVATAIGPHIVRGIP